MGQPGHRPGAGGVLATELHEGRADGYTAGPWVRSRFYLNKTRLQWAGVPPITCFEVLCHGRQCVERWPESPSLSLAKQRPARCAGSSGTGSRTIRGEFFQRLTGST